MVPPVGTKFKLISQCCACTVCQRPRYRTSAQSNGAKWKAEPSPSKHDKAPRKRARAQIFRTSYTTQWPCVVLASNDCRVMLTVYFATKIFFIGHSC